MSPERSQQALDLDAVFAALEAPLALVDSPERKADVQRYLAAARIHLERAIFDLLSRCVEVVNESGGVKAQLRYESGRLILVVEPAQGASTREEEAGPAFAFEGDMEKVTIRLPRNLKELIDNAASMHGLSANSWYLRELARSIGRQTRAGFERGARPGWRENGPRRGGSLRGFVGGSEQEGRSK